MRKYAAAAAVALGLAGILAVPAVADEIIGTQGPDELVGTPNDDSIWARGGDDRVRARAGDDTVYAGAGADRVRAGAGWDRVFGAAGADYVVPGPGSDRVRSGFGNDEVEVSGDGRADYINCGSGAQDVVWWYVGDRPDASDVIVNCEIRRRVHR